MGGSLLLVSRNEISEHTADNINMRAGKQKQGLRLQVQLAQESNDVVFAKNLSPVKGIDVKEDTFFLFRPTLFRISKNKMAWQVDAVYRNIELLCHNTVNA